MALPYISVPITQATALVPRHLKTRKGLRPYPSPILKGMPPTCAIQFQSKVQIEAEISGSLTLSHVWKDSFALLLILSCVFYCCQLISDTFYGTISSSIFPFSMCADLPELLQVPSLFATKYGEEFAAAAAALSSALIVE